MAPDGASRIIFSKPSGGTDGVGFLADSTGIQEWAITRNAGYLPARVDIRAGQR